MSYESDYFIMIITGELSNHPSVSFIQDLIDAIKKVDSNYFSWKLYKGEDTKDAYCERVFAYELYHQLRCIMNPYNTVENIERYQGLTLNGETIKDNSFFNNLFSNLEQQRFIPDLVLHKDLGKVEEEGQIYLAEIKMSENVKALDDLAKLTMLSKSSLNFSCYIFIIVGKNKDELKQELGKIETENLSKDIVCICTKYGDASAHYLKEIIS